MLVNALANHAIGKISMKPTQVTAALGLLRKVMPDLSATELSGEVARPTVIRAPQPIEDSQAWLEKYGPKPATPALPSAGADKPKLN